MTREERDRPALLLVDQRQAMFFGTVHAMKASTAAEVAALAAWRILGQGDRVGGIVLSDAGLAEVPARRSRAAVLRLLAEIAGAQRRALRHRPGRARGPGAPQPGAEAAAAS